MACPILYLQANMSGWQRKINTGLEERVEKYGTSYLISIIWYG